MSYWIYILTNRRNITFYIGMTRDPGRRITEHQRGEGSSFTRKYRLDKLVYLEEVANPYDALDRENELKGWVRSRKELLIAAVNPNWEEIDLFSFTKPNSPAYKFKKAWPRPEQQLEPARWPA